MTSRTASTHTKGKNEEILLRPWTRRQMSRSCGEPLKEFMADQNVRQKTKQLRSMEARSHRPSSLPPGSTNIQQVKAGKTHFFRRDPISNKGDKDEILGDGTDIHRGSSDETNPVL